MKKTIISVSVSVFVALSSSAQETTQEKEGHAEFGVGSVFLTFKSDTLGKNQDTTVWSNSKQFFYTPAILPEWGAYGKEVEQTCGQEQNDNTVELPLEIVLDNQSYKNEVVERINVNIDKSGEGGEGNETKSIKPDSQLYTIPYNIFVISLQLKGEPKTILYDSITDAEDSYSGRAGYVTTQKVAMDNMISVNINGSCAYHRRIVDAVTKGQKHLVTGEIYRNGAVYDITRLEYSSVFQALDKLKNKVFSDETVTINTNTKSQGKGVAINLSSLLKGSSSVSETTSHSDISGLRVVNRKFIQNALENITQSSKITCDGTKCTELLKVITDKLFDEDYGKAYISRNSKNGIYEIVAGQVNYVTPEDSGVNSKLDSVFYMKNKDESDKSAQIGDQGLTVKKKQNIDNEVKQTGNASLGNVPLANNVDLYIISENFFSQAKSSSMLIREPISGKTHNVKFKMIYPYLGYKKGIIKTIEEEKRIAEADKQSDALEKQCLNKELTNKKTVHAQSVSERSSRRFDIETPIVTASASKGFYIPNSTNGYKAVYTGTTVGRDRHKIFIGAVPMQPNEGGKKRDGKALMLKSVQYKFTCGRGANRLNPNSCTAKGYVELKEEPIKCAEFLIP